MVTRLEDQLWQWWEVFAFSAIALWAGFIQCSMARADADWRMLREAA